MEYEYDDWCLGQMAKVLGKTDDFKLFDERSNNWCNLFDPKSGFTERNAFNYS